MEDVVQHTSMKSHLSDFFNCEKEEKNNNK